LNILICIRCSPTLSKLDQNPFTDYKSMVDNQVLVEEFQNGCNTTQDYY
jgi:hypothetical protein